MFYFVINEILIVTYFGGDFKNRTQVGARGALNRSARRSAWEF